MEESIAQRTTLGFWVYLMTDCILFASLFVTYGVLHGNTFGGPRPKDVFNLPFVLVETLLLLTSSFTSGLAMLALQKQATRAVLGALSATFVLGTIFLGMELYEFTTLVHEGNGWQRSGFFSALFTLVGTHGAHIAAGLIWIIVLAAQFIKQGITPHTARRLTIFGLFWHFLDIVWIFIFSLVFLLGAL